MFYGAAAVDKSRTAITDETVDHCKQSLKRRLRSSYKTREIEFFCMKVNFCELNKRQNLPHI
jgi:hypothetical protein